LSLFEEKPESSHSLPLYFGLILLLILGGLTIWSIVTSTKIDDVTLCEVGKRNNVTVILFDKTGGFSANQSRMITKVIEAKVKELNEGERLAVYKLDDREYEGLSLPMFDKCRPQSEESVNELIENKQMIAKTYNELFMDELHIITENLNEKSDAYSSPILESLTDISSLYSIDKNLKLKNVILISDLLQHSKDFSFYENNSIKSNLKKLSLLPEFFGVNVQVYWLLRTGKEQKIQSNGVIEWWEDIFTASEANDLKVRKIR